MGQHADDAVDGLCCEMCGIYFEAEHGYPVVCRDCWKSMSDEERKGHQKATEREL